MYVFRNRRWSALVVVFSLAAPSARAGMITPDSIPNPPSPVGSNRLVNANNIVGSQYISQGLNIFAGAAITNINNVAVWVPADTTGAILPHGPLGVINYGYGLYGSFVSPGTINSTTVSSFSLTMLGSQPFGVRVYGDRFGQLLNIAPLVRQTSGGQTWSFTGADITSFSAFHNNNNSQSMPWGVASVSFTPTTSSTPEPSTLALAGLGLLGLATRFGWRRRRQLA
jgi:MYXO-CTERM domain-containing protein